MFAVKADYVAPVGNYVVLADAIEGCRIAAKNEVKEIISSGIVARVEPILYAGHEIGFRVISCGQEQVSYRAVEL